MDLDLVSSLLIRIPRRLAIQAWLLAALFVGVALALRLYGIDMQSLWADEGSAIVLAQHSLSEISLATAQNVHPVLYYWMLHIWMELFGTGVVAVRSLSALCGALTVGMTFLIGRRWFGHSAACIAAVAALVSPLALYYSQETRMYMLATFLGTLTWLLCECWLLSPRPAWLFGYALAAAAMIATHYYAAALLVAGNVVVGLTLLQRYRSAAGRLPYRSGRLWWQGVAGQALSWATVQLGLLALYAGMVLRSRTALMNWSSTAGVLRSPWEMATDL